jgi:hypothetical protein
MLDNAFRRPISVDRAPEGHLCDWCCKPAVHQLTAIGGICHNQGGFFCPECAEEFAYAVAESMNRIITADTQASLPDPAHLSWS